MKQFYLYSAQENAFYPISAPSDAVKITEERHTELFNGQSDGKAIKPNKAGYPIIVEQGRPYEVWNQESESSIIDEKLYQKYLKDENQRIIQSIHDDLENIERKITRLERIKQRTETEELELDALIEQSTILFREIKALEIEESEAK